jgi:biopolymer transport protein ExbB/TolQ
MDLLAARRSAAFGGGALRLMLPLVALVLLTTATVLARYALSAHQFASHAKSLSQKLQEELTETQAAREAAMVARQQFEKQAQQQQQQHQQNATVGTELQQSHERVSRTGCPASQTCKS